MKIGIFDSGIGGLSVLHRAKKMIPDAEFIYYADEEHVPYGEKTEAEIKGFVEEILQFMVEKETDAAIIACNTATSVADKEFRAGFPIPIVGMEPAVKKACEQYGREGRRILVAATPVTIAGNKLHDLLERVDKYHDVDLIPLPMLVRFAERGEFESEEITEYLREALKEFQLDLYDVVVLGCTHFNYFKKHFRKVISKELHFVDGNEGTLKQLLRVIPEEKKLEKTEAKVTYYFSGREITEEEQLRIDTYLRQLDLMYEIG